MRINGFDLNDHKDEIIDMYINKKMSSIEIADYFGVSKTPILRIFRDFNVDKRTCGETLAINQKGLKRYNAKCVLVKDVWLNIIAVFECETQCGEWLSNLGLFKNEHSGAKRVRKCIRGDIGYNGLWFFKINKEEYLRNKDFKSIDYDIKKYIENFSEKNIIIEVNDISGKLIKTFKHIEDCCEWLVKNNIHSHINAARKAITKYKTKNQLEKYKYYYKRYSNTEYYQKYNRHLYLN